MAGLLDLTDDPQTLGLLSLGLRLMSTPGRFGTALGQSGLGAIGDMQQARTAQEQRKSRAMQEQLMMQQLEAAKRQQAEQEAAKAKQAQDAALMRRLLNQPVESQFGGVGPGVPMRNTGVDPSTFLAQGGSMEALPQALMLNQALRPAAPKLTVSKPGDIARTETGEVAWENPTPAEKPDLTPLAKLIAERDALPPGHPARPIYDARIAKETTHPEGVKVSYGAPMAGQDAQGNPVYFMPPKDPTRAEPHILPGVRPPAKEMPAGMADKFAQNEVTLQKIDQAITAVDANPKSFGLKNYAGDLVMQRLDPKGVEARALIADIGGQKIHDRSGAAVTVGEAERLKPYIPAATDEPATIKKKLQLFRNEYAAMQKALASGASIKQAAAKGAPSGWSIVKD